MPVTQTNYNAGELLNHSQETMIINGFNQLRAEELRPEELMTHIRISDNSATSYKFKRILPAQVFTRQLVNACPALESSCAVNNEFELSLFKVRYMNEEFRPEGRLTPELRQEFIQETATVWNEEEMREIFQFLQDTFTSQPVSGDFATNGRKEIFKTITELEKKSGINRRYFTVVLSQEASDTMLEQNLVIPGFYGAVDTVSAANSKAASTFGVANVVTARQGQLADGVLYMVYIKPYVFSGSNMFLAPGFDEVKALNVPRGTMRYFAEEYYGMDVYAPEVGLIVTDASAGGEVRITVAKQTHDIMQADMATMTDEEAIAIFSPQVVGDDTLSVEVAFNGIIDNLENSNYGGGSIVFQVPDRYNIQPVKVHVNVINDGTVSLHGMQNPGEEITPPAL